MAEALASMSASASGQGQSGAVGETKRSLPSISSDAWSRVLHVPAVICVEVPVVGLTVRQLFRLEKGSVVATSQLSGAHVPVYVGGRLLAWGEFQVAGEFLAVRVAEIS